MDDIFVQPVKLLHVFLSFTNQNGKYIKVENIEELVVDETLVKVENTEELEVDASMEKSVVAVDATEPGMESSAPPAS